jgi:dolichol-phosphate mannosyltransferase
MAKACVIIPTYNERENLPRLVPQILQESPNLDVLIVDDASPDGTGSLADALAQEDGRVHVLHRTGKLGLGTAYVDGFRWCLARDYDVIFEMDADFSHDPRDLPRLIAAAEAADLVLGSRYVTGGGINRWGRLRRFVSRGGSAYARFVLGVPVHDLTGGFKCFRRRVLETIDLADVHANGYGFQIELTYKAVRAGFTVKEIPILFGQRSAGVSKMTPRIALEAVWKVPLLRFRA